MTVKSIRKYLLPTMLVSAMLFTAGCGNIVETSSAVVPDETASGSIPIADEAGVDSEIVPDNPTEPAGDDTEEVGFSEEELSDMDAADTAISDLVSSQEFKEKSLEEREEVVWNLLYSLVSDGLIQGDTIYHESGSDMFSFAYKNGVLGGVKITDWDEGIKGSEPLNDS